MADKVVWADDKNIFVIRKGKTSNDKISNGKELVQTYTFSREQYDLATTSKGFGMKKFFALDGANCLDCKFSGNKGEGGCYTHKFNQYVGFLSMLRSIKPEQLSNFDGYKWTDCVSMAKDTYVRFGTYGEPSLIPIALVESMANAASSYTGYTHQWKKNWAQKYSTRFMASTHSQFEADVATRLGYRSFIATDNGQYADVDKGIACPASKEMNYISNCAKCGLCSGSLGKGSKNVKILIH